MKSRNRGIVLPDRIFISEKTDTAGGINPIHREGCLNEDSLQCLHMNAAEQFVFS